MKKYGNEFKIGLFVIACISGLIYLTFSTGKVQLNRKGYHIYVTFGDIAGLEKRAPVLLNGLEVGKVDEIKFSYDADRTKMILKLWIDEEAKIREGAEVSIKTLGLMGEKYIQIFSCEGSTFIQPETVLKGNPFLDLDSLLAQAKSITEDLSGKFEKLLDNVNSTIEDNREGINHIVRNLELTSKNFEELSGDIKQHPWKILYKEKDKK